MIQFSDLITPRARAEISAQILQALKGVGFVRQVGTGSGGVAAAGVATTTASVVVKITTAGELGTAAFSVSLTGGLTYAAPVTVPVGGIYAVTGTGVTLTFSAGSSSTDASFALGDTYSFAISTPTLQTTDWHATSVPVAFIDVDAQVLEDLDGLIAKIARSGLIDYADDNGFLDLVGSNVYGTDRSEAQFTQGTVVLTDAAAAGPFTVTIGQLWVTSSSGRRYRNTTGGTLALSGTLALTFQAESPGSAWNVGNGTITTMVTALAGVTVSNPDPGGGSWVTQQGVDREAAEAYRTRCKQRWGTIGPAANADGWAYWAKSASTQVTRVLVQASATVPGETDIFLAGPAGGVDAGVVSTVDAALQPKVPTTCSLVTASASNSAVTVAGTVKVAAVYAATAQAAIETALAALFASIPIGGTKVGLASGIVSREAIIAAIGVGQIAGVLDLDLTTPAADTSLTATQIPTLTDSLAYSQI